jgi:hypothetical protein
MTDALHLLYLILIEENADAKSPAGGAVPRANILKKITPDEHPREDG